MAKVKANRGLNVIKRIAVDRCLKNWRRGTGLSQRDAALKLGVPKKTLQDWEQGRRTPRGLALSALLDRINAEKEDVSA
jgi:DNA-binding transcriptional regulator YiaG